MIICQICQRECKNYFSLSSHMRYKHRINVKQYYDKYLKKDNEGICPECGKETTFISLTRGYLKHCSNKCSNNSKEIQDKKKKSYLEKYGVESPLQSKELKDKFKQTNLKRYGIENGGGSDISLNKIKKICQDKYGVDNPFQSKEIQNKIKQTCLKRYGVTSPFKCKDTKTKLIKNRLINQYNNKILKLEEVKPLFSVEEYKGIIIEISKKNYIYIKYKWQCVKCGNIFEDSLHSKLPRCLICHPLKPGYSLQEKEVVSYIKSIYAGQIIENSRSIISPYELDIYLPELKLAVEYNGDYWHSMLPKNYHKIKTNLCQKYGIKLIHISESDWLNNQNNIKDSINSLIV